MVSLHRLRCSRRERNDLERFAVDGDQYIDPGVPASLHQFLSSAGDRWMIIGSVAGEDGPDHADGVGEEDCFRHCQPEIGDEVTTIPRVENECAIRQRCEQRHDIGELRGAMEWRNARRSIEVFLFALLEGCELGTGVMLEAVPTPVRNRVL